MDLWYKKILLGDGNFCGIRYWCFLFDKIMFFILLGYLFFLIYYFMGLVVYYKMS